MFVQDDTGTLGQSAIHQIEGMTTQFDVKVLVTSKYTKAQLDAQVGQMVNTPNTVAIGADPIHRYTFTHFGVGTGVPKSDFQRVATAGNPEFRAGHWDKGIANIIQTANASATTAALNASITAKQAQQVVVVQQPAVPSSSDNVGFLPYLPLVIGFGLVVVGLVFLRRWQKKRDFEITESLRRVDAEASEFRSRNIEEQGWHDKMRETMKQTAPKEIEEERTFTPDEIKGSFVKRAQPLPRSRPAPERRQPRRGFLYRDEPPPSQWSSTTVVVTQQPDNFSLGYALGREQSRNDDPPPSSHRSSSDGGSGGGSIDIPTPSFDMGGGGGDVGGGSGPDGGGGGGDI